MNNPLIKILHEDNFIIAVHKPAGLATQTKKIGQKDLFTEMKNHVGGSYIGIINRLDQPVEGIVLMAKDPKSAANLENQIQNRLTQKYYRATVYMTQEFKSVQKKEIITKLTDYMYKDSQSNLSHICSASHPHAQKAELEYKITALDNDYATLDIHLLTGRHHQIRLQLSHAGLPILGDTKYGNRASIDFSKKLNIKNVALCAYKYSFKHPNSGEALTICIDQ